MLVIAKVKLLLSNYLCTNHVSVALQHLLVGEGHCSAWHVQVPLIVYRPISLKLLHHDVEILITKPEINNKRSFGLVARPI